MPPARIHSLDPLDRFHDWLNINQGLGVWLTGGATMGLVVGVIFAWFALRDARKTRHAQLLADFSSRWDSKEMNESAALGRAFAPKGLVELSNKIYGPDSQHPAHPDDLEKWKANLADWYIAIAWPNLLETVGVMVHAKALPRELVYQLWGGPIIDAWSRDWELATVAHRDHLGDDNVFRYFAWLAEKMNEERRRDAFYAAAGKPGPVGPAISAASSQGWAAGSAGR